MQKISAKLCLASSKNAASSILIMIVSRSIARLVWINENIYVGLLILAEGILKTRRIGEKFTSPHLYSIKNWTKLL